MQQYEQGSAAERIKTGVGILTAVCGTLAVSLEVFLHRSASFGERYMGLRAAAAILLIPFYAIFWPEHDATPLIGLLLAYLAMCFCIRIGVLTRARRGGQQVHSLYNGYPRLMTVTRGLFRERTVKLIVEPVLTLVIGALTMALSQPLGGYLMVASVGLLVSVHLSAGYDRVRAMDMYDAYVEQQQLSSTFQHMRGDRF